MDELLTPEERRCLDVSGELAGRLRAIIGDGPTAHGDWAEAAAAIHVLQRMVMGNAAARAYPTEYRLLGQRVVPMNINDENQEESNNPVLH